MEVHHHLHVKKKNFKEYFLEFLMIFIAVALGFFAENIRKNITEHNKAKELSKSLINDLASNTSQLIQTVDTIKWSNKKLDTLIKILNEPVNNSIASQLYYYSKLTDNQFL